MYDVSKVLAIRIPLDPYRLRDIYRFFVVEVLVVYVPHPNCHILAAGGEEADLVVNLLQKLQADYFL